jgi:hypothetical protein
VRSVGVVVDPPCFDDVARLVDVGEQVFVEALVAQSAVEALHKAILHRFTRRDVAVEVSAVDREKCCARTLGQSSELVVARKQRSFHFSQVTIAAQRGY